MKTMQTIKSMNEMKEIKSIKEMKSSELRALEVIKSELSEEENGELIMKVCSLVASRFTRSSAVNFPYDDIFSYVVDKVYAHSLSYDITKNKNYVAFLFESANNRAKNFLSSRNEVNSTYKKVDMFTSYLDGKQYTEAQLVSKGVDVSLCERVVVNDHNVTTFSELERDTEMSFDERCSSDRLSTSVRAIDNVLIKEFCSTLTERQHEILHYKMQGYNNTEIADVLGIARTNIVPHLKKIKEKAVSFGIGLN